MQPSTKPFSRIVVSALRGGAGKTVVSIGLIAAWRRRGQKVAPFKKGPDYIDAGWLELAAGGRSCRNLDTFLIPPERVLQSLIDRTESGDMAVVEGNRGLYDGIDTRGSTSTAELAKLIRAPVLLCLDCTKTTRTMAAAVLGCMHFDDAVTICGVVLNRVAGPRHESILRRNIEQHCGIPVLGAIPKLGQSSFPERHMGLVPTAEHHWAHESVTAAERVAETHLDLETIAAAAREHSPQIGPQSQESPDLEMRSKDQVNAEPPPVIGIIRDSAFQFYYPENLEALEAAGARLRFISPLSGPDIGPLDALYIGGGFPETHAAQLARNLEFRQQLKSMADRGLPIYAECGGLMFLGAKLILDEGSYPMAGVLPVEFGFCKRPQGHGYTIAAVEGPNPYYPVGTRLRGHEFHYSRVLNWCGSRQDLVFRMQRGNGIVEGRDGLCVNNVLATYAHMHALGTPTWAPALVAQARAHRERQSSAVNGPHPSP